MDKEKAHNAFMAALRGIAVGKDHTDTVYTYGASVKIFDGLNNAVKHLPENFHADDDMTTVNNAMRGRSA